MAWWMLQNFAVAALVGVLAWVLGRWGRLSPAARHMLWVLVLVKLLTPPLWGWPVALGNSAGSAPGGIGGGESAAVLLRSMLFSQDDGAGGTGRAVSAPGATTGETGTSPAASARGMNPAGGTLADGGHAAHPAEFGARVNPWGGVLVGAECCGGVAFLMVQAIPWTRPRKLPPNRNGGARISAAMGGRQSTCCCRRWAWRKAWRTRWERVRCCGLRPAILTDFSRMPPR